VNVVGLVSGWCPTCEREVFDLDRLRSRLQVEEGLDINCYGVNSIDAVTDQHRLLANTSIPLFQDTPEVKAWEQHGGRMGDLFVYGPSGLLYRHVPLTAKPVNVFMYTPDGFATVKQIVRNATVVLRSSSLLRPP
jgi:hypothetical protein